MSTLLLRRLYDVASQQEPFEVSYTSDHTGIQIIDTRYGERLITIVDLVEGNFRFSLKVTGRMSNQQYNCIRRYLDKLNREYNIDINFDETTKSFAASCDFKADDRIWDGEAAEVQIDDTLDRLRDFRRKHFKTILKFFSDNCP